MRNLVPIALLLAGCLFGREPGEDQAPPEPRSPRTAAPELGVLRLAGSGVLSPLMEILADRLAQDPQNPVSLQVICEEHIGSAGGIRAAAEGAIDIGLVSRPLQEAETKLGLLEFPLFVDAVVLAAHPTLPIAGLRSDEVRDLYRGVRRSPKAPTLVLLLRDPAESANLALEGAIPGLFELRQKAQQSHRYRILYHDRAMAEALLSTRGAIGVFSLGAIIAQKLPLKVLALDGITPSAALLREGKWPAQRILRLVLRPDRLERSRPFVEFARSNEARALARAAGYEVLP